MLMSNMMSFACKYFFDHGLGFKCEGCLGFTQPIINLVESPSRIKFIDTSLATDSFKFVVGTLLDRRIYIFSKANNPFKF